MTSITEVVGMEQDIISLQELFVFRQQGATPPAGATGNSRRPACLRTLMRKCGRRVLCLLPRFSGRGSCSGPDRRSIASLRKQEPPRWWIKHTNAHVPYLIITTLPVAPVGTENSVGVKLQGVMSMASVG